MSIRTGYVIKNLDPKNGGYYREEDVTEDFRCPQFAMIIDGPLLRKCILWTRQEADAELVRVKQRYPHLPFELHVVEFYEVINLVGPATNISIQKESA